jgi:hypothetical protein
MTYKAKLGSLIEYGIKRRIPEARVPSKNISMALRRRRAPS